MTPVLATNHRGDQTLCFNTDKASRWKEGQEGGYNNDDYHNDDHYNDGDEGYNDDDDNFHCLQIYMHIYKYQIKNKLYRLGNIPGHSLISLVS